MKDDSLEEVLSNIEKDDRDRKTPWEQEADPDPNLNKTIKLDLDPPGDEDILDEKIPLTRKPKSSKKKKQYIEDDLDEITPTPQEEDAAPPPEDQFADPEFDKKQNPKFEISGVQGTMDQASVRYNIKGNRSWNTREPYTIKVSKSKLESNYTDLGASFHFVENPEVESATQGKLKRAMLKDMTGGSSVLSDRYREFIYKYIVIQVKEITDSYNLKSGKEDLFIYHTGVLTMYRIIIYILHYQKIGVCFKRLPDNKVVKHVPTEFIKEVCLNWFEDNIHTCAIPFDGIQEFNEIKRFVTGRYYGELEKYNKMLDKMIARLKLNQERSFNREEYFRNKWDEWFGRTNIIIYNRFIERTIFKYDRQGLR